MAEGNGLDAYTPLEFVLEALRRPANEPQLTQALAAFACSDSAFAARLAEVFVADAPTAKRAALGPLPKELACEAEVVLGSGRRVDVRFEGADGRFGLLVELKIDAGYGHEQLDDYIHAADELGYDRVGLVAVTKSPPWYGEDKVSTDQRWLGSVRWSRIHDRLRQISHSQLDEAWKGFLRVVADQGDFGIVALDRDAVRGWARYREGSLILKALMDEMATPALDVIRHELAVAGGREPSDGEATSVKKRMSPVYLWNDRVALKFAVPARTAPEERLRIHFFAPDGKLYFAVEARYPDARPLLAGPDLDERLSKLTAALSARQPMFKQGHDWESYWSRWHSMEQLIERGENPVEKLLEWVREDVRDLAGEGLFDTLQEISERQLRPPSPSHDE